MTDKEKIEMLSNGYGNGYIITLVNEARGERVGITMTDIAYFFKLLQAENEEKEKLLKQQANLINRLKEYDRERDIRLHASLIATAKADAFEEFANRLEKEFMYVGMHNNCAIKKKIRDILNELRSNYNAK